MSSGATGVARLEAEAFKRKVVDALKEHKIQDSLKSVVRLKLVEKIGADPAAKSLLSQKLANLTLAEKLTCSLIKSFLHSKELLMSESVFDSEAGEAALLDDAQTFELLASRRPIVKETLQAGGYIGPSANSSKQQAHAPSLLVALITGITRDRMQTYDSSTQTVSSMADLGLDERLMLVEEAHRGQVAAGKQTLQQTVENRVRDLRQQMLLEKDLDIKRIHDIESARIRAEESARWREKYQEDRDAFERAYHTKVAALREQETKALEALSEKAKKLDADNFNKMNALTKQVEYFERDCELKRSELNMQKNDLDRINVHHKQFEADLKKRDEELSAKEVTFEQRLKQEVDIYKAVTLREISEKKDQIDAKLAKLNEELDNLAEMRRRMDLLSEKNTKLQTSLDEERNRYDALADEKKLIARERDEIKEHLSIMSTNMRRLETEFERSNSKIQTFSSENQHLKDLNGQLRDLLNTYNNESKKLRSDYEKKEEDYERKIAELNKALLLQEKRMVDKVIESIDFKHNAYLGRAAESEFIGRLDKDFEAMRQKRKEIHQQMEKEDLRPPGESRPASSIPLVQQPSTTFGAQQASPAAPSREASHKPAVPAEPKRVSIDDFNDLDF